MDRRNPLPAGRQRRPAATAASVVARKRTRVKRRRHYGMLTFTRKKRLAELVGAHDLSVSFSLPSTV